MRNVDRSVPCYNCDKRSVGCHSSCESYKEYRKKISEKQEAIRKKKDEEEMLTDTRIRSMKKTRKVKSKQTAWKG